jgi:hypothetical protein
MLVTNPDVASLDRLLSSWESAEYIAEAFVILGCVGEFTAEFTDIRTPEWRHQLSKISLLVLIAALAIELGALVRTNGLSGQEIALLNGVAADARTRAANAEGTAKGFDSKIAEARRGTAEAQRDAEIARKDASKADERAAANEKEAARLGKAAEDERLARVKIEEAIAWRRLAPERRAELAVYLKGFSGQRVWLIYNLNDVEAFGFAMDLATALQLAKWDATEPEPIWKMTEGPVPVGTHPLLERGVVISSTEDKTSRDASNALVRELLSFGFDANKSSRPAINQSTPSPTVFLSVEPRPEGPQGEAKLRAQRQHNQVNTK